MQHADTPACLAALPQELFLQVTSFLNVSSLLTMRTLNKCSYEICSKDSAGWTGLCQSLWKDKIFVCPRAKVLLPAMQAYRASIDDSKKRENVHPDTEFMYCPETETGPIWHFRFKEAAGPDWTSWDPWWNGRPSRKMVFLRNGSICQYVCQGEDYQHDVLLRNPTEYGRTLPKSGSIILDPPVSMKWRFCERPMDLPLRERGSYIRLSVGGRDVPTYVVRRSPTGNWGFMAESCWGVYTSFDMPLRRTENGEGAADTNNGDDDAMNGSTAAASASAMPSPTMDEATQQFNMLADDSSFIITNEVQWREALLYNFGATVLPEGDTATEDFDRMFGQTLQHRAAVAAGATGGVAMRTMDQQQQPHEQQAGGDSSVPAAPAPAQAVDHPAEMQQQEQHHRHRMQNTSDDDENDNELESESDDDSYESEMEE